MAQDISIYDEDTLDCLNRTNNRLGTMLKASIALLNSYLDGNDPYSVAKGKVKDVSKAIRASDPTAKFDFMLGEPEFLIAAINKISESDYPHFTEEKKELVINILKRLD